LHVRAGLRALGMAAIAAVAVFTISAPTPAAAATTSPTAAQRVIAIARSELGKPWRYAATGPRAFDCSGLVVYAFHRAGVGNRIGGGHSAYGMLRWARAHHLASRTNPQPGDLVIYGGGSHVGIYIGGGRVISTLTNGVRITGVFALHSRFTAYVHTGLSRTAAAKVASSAKATSASASSTHVRSWRRTTAALRLRASDSTRSAVLKVLPVGSKVGVLGTAHANGRTWYHVRAAGRTGWVAASYTRAA
jgi:hypothetical protein